MPRRSPPTNPRAPRNIPRTTPTPPRTPTPQHSPPTNLHAPRNTPRTTPTPPRTTPTTPIPVSGTGVLNFVDGIYEGEYTFGNIREGKGIMRYFNGEVYEGNWENNMISGNGSMRYANGDVYAGEFIPLFSMAKVYLKSIKEGYTGCIRLENGTSIYSNGYLYDGAISTAHGIMIYANGDVYKGQWYNDFKHRSGVMNYANGDVYSGEWVNDLKHGKGNMFYVNGDVYKGKWLNGLRNGIGIMTDANGDDVYEGEWVNDSPVNVVQSTPNLIELQSFKHIPNDFNIYDPITMYDENLHEFLKTKDNLVFIFGNNYYPLSRETIKTQMKNPENIVYECYMEDPPGLVNLRERKINEDKYNKKVKYLSLRSLALPGNYIPLNRIKHIYSDEHEQIFNLIKTDKKLASVISENVIKTIDFVSALHCQAGQGGYVYDVDKKIIRAYSKRNRKNILSITKRKKGYFSKSKSSKLRSNVFFPHESNSKSSKSK